MCFYCGDECKNNPKNPQRKDYRIVKSANASVKEITLKTCKKREDAYSKAIEHRILSEYDLVEVQARYHTKCRLDFERIVRIELKKSHAGNATSKNEAFNMMCEKLEHIENSYTVQEFSESMTEYGAGTWDNRIIKSKLEMRYGESINFITGIRKSVNSSPIIVLDMVKQYLVDEWYKNKSGNDEAESHRVIELASKLIKNCIKIHVDRKDVYPSLEDIKLDESSVPDLLKKFMIGLTNDVLKQESLAQAIYAAVKPRSIMPLQFSLGVSVENKYSSKWLTETLHKFGFAISNNEIIRYKQNVIEFDTTDDIAVAHGDTFCQFVGDNTDHDTNTLDGKNTHHGLGSIMVFNGLDGSFGPKPIYRKDIPRKKKVNWDQVTNNEGIPILSFAMNGISPLQKVKFQRLEHDGAYFPNPAELLWICSKLKAEKVPNWAGFMSTFSKSTSTMPSSIVMLPASYY